MLAIINPLGALSRKAFVVCYAIPAFLFVVVAIALSLLVLGRIAVSNYFTAYAMTEAVGLVIFFDLCFTTTGMEVITEVIRKRREMGVLLWLMLLMVLGAALPRAFGFIW